MEIEEALGIVRELADGVHPDTGEVLQNDCLVQHPQSVRALHRAAGALEFQDETGARQEIPAGKCRQAWSNQEDAQICEELRHGLSFEQIAKSHNRKDLCGSARTKDCLIAYMQGNRIYALTFACIAVFAARLLHGQTNGQTVATSLAQQKRQLADREKWRMSGLRIPCANPAALRGRAIHQKTQTRSARFLGFASSGIGGSPEHKPHPRGRTPARVT